MREAGKQGDAPRGAPSEIEGRWPHKFHGQFNRKHSGVWTMKLAGTTSFDWIVYLRQLQLPSNHKLYLLDNTICPIVVFLNVVNVTMQWAPPVDLVFIHLSRARSSNINIILSTSIFLTLRACELSDPPTFSSRLPLQSCLIQDYRTFCIFYSCLSAICIETAILVQAFS